MMVKQWLSNDTRGYWYGGVFSYATKFFGIFWYFWSDLCSLNTLFLCGDIMLRLRSAIDMFTCSMHFTGIPMLVPLIYFSWCCSLGIIASHPLQNFFFKNSLPPEVKRSSHREKKTTTTTGRPVATENENAKSVIKFRKGYSRARKIIIITSKV